MGHSNLITAKKVKNDEFYTQYHDIEKEINAYVEYNPDVFNGKTILLPCDDPEWSNFTKFFAQKFKEFGIKKLISTSYAANSKNYESNYQPTLFETEDPQYDKKKTTNHGKIFTLTKDTNKDGKIDVDDLEWGYLEGDGDFQSDEVKKLRDEADIIITNPPFSLFRSFLDWVVKSNNQFVIIGNMNAITYKEVFPLIKENKIWLGSNTSSKGNSMTFKDVNKIDVDVASKWFTNIDHARRHEFIPLMTMADNRKFHKQIQKRETSYQKYENFNAIEVPFTNAIPIDYTGVMGVPISFLTKYNPDQFEIIGLGIANLGLDVGVGPYKTEHRKYRKEIQGRGAVDGDLYMMVKGIVTVPFARVLIKHKQ